jgi:hypothetical protein
MNHLQCPLTIPGSIFFQTVVYNPPVGMPHKNIAGLKQKHIVVFCPDFFQSFWQIHPRGLNRNAGRWYEE